MLILLAYSSVIHGVSSRLEPKCSASICLYKVMNLGIDTYTRYTIDNGKYLYGASWQGEYSSYYFIKHGGVHVDSQVSLHPVQEHLPYPLYKVELLEAYTDDTDWHTALFSYIFLVDDHFRSYLGQKSNLSDSVKNAEQYIEEFRRQSNKELFASYLYDLGVAHFSLGNYDESEVYLKESYNLYLSLSYDYSAQYTQLLLGLLYHSQSDYSNARIIFDFIINSKQSHKHVLALAHNNMGMTLNDTGQFHQAIKYLVKAIELHKNSSANSFSSTADYDKHGFDSIYDNRASFDHYLISSYNNIALSFQGIGDYHTALDYWSLQLPLINETSDRKQQILGLHNIGGAYSKIGEIADALRYVMNSRELSIETSNKFLYALTTNTLGQINMTVGHYDTAKVLFEEAIYVRTGIDDPKGLRESLLADAQLSILVNNFDRARRRAQEALTSAKNDDHKVQMNDALILLASIDLQTERLDDAISLLKEHEADVLDIGSIRTISNFYSVLAESYFQAGDFATAESTFLKALKLVQGALNVPLEIEIQTKLAGLYKAMNQPAKAMSRANSSIELIERMRSILAQNDHRRSYMQRSHDAYSQLALLHRQNDQMIDLLNASQLTKSRTLLDELALGDQPVDDRLIELGETYKSQLAALSNRKHKDAGTRERIHADMKATLAEIDQVRHQNITSVDMSSTRSDIDASLKRFPDDTLIIDYLLNDDESLVTYSISGQLHSFTLPARRDIESKVKPLLEQLHTLNRSNDQAALISEVSNLLLANLDELDLDSVKSVVVIPDGILHQLPFSVLRVPTRATADVSGNSIKNNRLRLQDFDSLTYVPSLLALQQNDQSTELDSARFLALGDPVFDSSDSRIQSIASAETDGDDETDALEPTLAILDNSSGFDVLDSMVLRSGNRSDLKRLASSLNEIQSAIKFVDANQSKSLTGFSASRKQLEANNLGQYDILHFATHGFNDAEYPEFSGLVLSRFDERGNEIPGYLRAAEISQWDLDADLVVLSSCESAVGRILKGEGALSLSRAFLEAGATNVLASLWKVDDRATADLMSHFYGNVANGLSYAEALQKAKKAIQEVPAYRDPFYWAGFKLTTVASPTSSNTSPGNQTTHH